MGVAANAHAALRGAVEVVPRDSETDAQQQATGERRDGIRNVNLRLSDDVLLQTHHLCFLCLVVQAMPVPAYSLANINRSPVFHRRFVRRCKASTDSGITASYWGSRM